jgi:biopolymer transport protein TolQ
MDQMSFVSLFMNADLLVKSVMIILVIASLWSWVIILSKTVKIARMSKLSYDFEDMFWATRESLEDIFRRIGNHPQDPLSAIFCAGMQEWKRSSSRGTLKSAIQQRVEKSVQVSITREMDHLESRIGFLASVGSTAPYIGLLGTVWGIINSFKVIATQKSASLATVAPVIAEALFATALGLLAAIPAVLAYNRLSDQINKMHVRMDAFANEFVMILSNPAEESSSNSYSQKGII